MSADFRVLVRDMEMTYGSFFYQWSKLCKGLDVEGWYSNLKRHLISIVCLFGTRSLWNVLLSSMIYGLFKQILPQMNIFLLNRPFHSWFYLFLLFASSVRCWCFQRGIKNECNNPRTTIWMNRTLNFVNIHWGRILNPNNATQTHSIFIKL